MTPTNDAEKAFKNYADKFCSIGYDPTEDYKIIAAALARSAKVDGLLEALNKFMRQISICNYRDSEDHDIKMNHWYIETLKEIQQYNGKV